VPAGPGDESGCRPRGLIVGRKDTGGNRDAMFEGQLLQATPDGVWERGEDRVEMS
jgi:hypothetical protein